MAVKSGEDFVRGLIEQAIGEFSGSPELAALVTAYGIRGKLP